jgi:heme A synthase
MESTIDRSSRDRTDILAIGFGTTVAMWTVGYICRIPPAATPGWLVLVLLFTCMAGGGFVAGRRTTHEWRGGLYVGLVSSILNLLILGSLLSGSSPNRVVPSALWWIPGSILVAVFLGILGADIAGHLTRGPIRRLDGTAVFARVAVAATFLLLVVGGLVTSKRAGLAVVDWPNSFGYSMFLYPLSRMTGGIYYEHAHRLFGSLVGLTTAVLALLLQKADSRRWLRRLAVAALLTVVAQGLLGGLRVTGRFTTSDSPADTNPNILLAVVHGVLGQVFFAMIVSIAVFTSTTWRGNTQATTKPSVSTDRALSVVLLGLLIVQLVLGAIQRHLAGGLIIHITMAMFVFLLAMACGLRAWGMYKEQPQVQRAGKMLTHGVITQVVLGIGALIFKGIEKNAAEPSTLSVMIRTMHQAMGAFLLAGATMLVLWTRRLLKPVE